QVAKLAAPTRLHCDYGLLVHDCEARGQVSAVWAIHGRTVLRGGAQAVDEVNLTRAPHDGLSEYAGCPLE
ncbi:MAG: hypothetical protein ABFC80_07510, partial [Coriobacteriales bacterium]